MLQAGERRVREGRRDSMLLAFGSFVTVAVLAAPVVGVESVLDCPSPAQVSEELERIVPNAAGAPATDRANVSSENGVLLVILRAPDGTLLGERRVTAEGTCDEQARAIAVILGVWLTDIHPEYRSALPLPPPTASEPSQPGDGSASDAAPPVTPPALPLPAPARPAAPPNVGGRARAQGGAERVWSGALAVGAEVSDAGAVLAGALSASYAPEQSGFGGSAFALLAMPAERSLGSGRVASFRWPFGVGPLLRVQARRAFLDVSAGPMLGWLHLAGDEFSENRTADDLAAGAFGRARIGVRWGGFRPFLEGGLLGWFGSTTAVAQRPETELELPAFELFLLSGVAFEL